MWNDLIQVCGQWGPEIQEFVMETSAVERFDIRMGQMEKYYPAYLSKETYRRLGVSGKAAAVSEAKDRGLV